MEKYYNHKEAEHRINLMWERNNYFTPKIDLAKKPFSIFLVPPNASGEMHIGNALMIAVQDILARYHRAKGDPTLWIPCTDHGGYETQVTFERELEKAGKDKWSYSSKGLFEEIKHFVEGNNETIKGQIKAMGASVDWSRFRFTMDNDSLEAVDKTFKKMVSDNLIYRRSYMAYYCPLCATILADIELKENKERTPLYFIKFTFQNSDDYLSLATTRPEFLFVVTHVLIHPSDKRYAHHIGKVLLNPVTGKPVEIVASKRKFDPENSDPFLSPFSPSYKKYDYEYTLRNSIPSQNLLDWEGNMLLKYPGMKPAEARIEEVLFLKEHGRIEKIDDSYLDSIFLCKRGHVVESVIMQTWFLKMDDEKTPLRKNALEVIKKEGLAVFPRWREKGLMDWMKKMHDWPIARQNVWGIKIPIWYDISDPSKFIVWFIDKKGEKRCGNLKFFLDQGVSLQEVSEGLERIYAAEDATWTLEPEADKFYLPETDTFDTWFSSGQWGTIVFGSLDGADFSYFYPSDSIVIGHDLLRLSVSRKILLSLYLTGKLPFKTVYLHRLIKGQDGQKMSKSLGNAVSLEYYLEKFGADVTRLALISYTTLREDFIIEEERLLFFQDFASRLWEIGRLINANSQHSLNLFKLEDLSQEDKYLLFEIDRLTVSVGSYLEKFSFAYAQEKLYYFLSILEKYIKIMQANKNPEVSLSVLKYAYKKYLITLYPFMPFMTEELYANLYNSICPLAANPWPDKMNYFGE
jgi:valyl-tRNA synthetase